MNRVDKEIAHKIEEEHQQLKMAMRKISEAISMDLTEKDFPLWQVDLLLSLRDFHSELLKHFDLEEVGGFMHDVLMIAPEKHRVVEQLNRDHERIDNALSAILDELKEMESLDRDRLTRIFTKIEAILLLLEKHEEAESDLIISTYFEDRGGRG